MGVLAAIAIGAAALGTAVTTPPEPPALTEVQRELLTSGMFEPDSFREPAFEALIENVRSWPADSEPWFPKNLNQAVANIATFERWATEDPGQFVIARGDVEFAEPVGGAFPGVYRLTLRLEYHGNQQALLAFIVDQHVPQIGDDVVVTGRAYKVMRLQVQRDGLVASFPAIVARYFRVPDHQRPTSGSQMTGAAVVTALTGALAVIFFVVIMGRHMLGRNHPPRPPLASTAQTPDDAPDA